MFGFILGTVCLVALGARFAKRRFGYGHGCHAGSGGHGWHGRSWGRHGHDHHGHHGDEQRGGFGGGRFSRHAQRWLFQQLQTTPGQETVIGEAFAEVTRAMDGLRDEAKKTREDIATAMRAEPFDQATLDSAFARQNVQVQETQRVFGESLAKVHEVLDAAQRKQLVGLLERLGWTRSAMGSDGPWAGGGEGPYRA